MGSLVRLLEGSMPQAGRKAKMSRGSVRLAWIMSAATLVVLSACAKSATPARAGAAVPLPKQAR